MSFSLQSRNIKVEFRQSSFYLLADCKLPNGTWNPSSVNLDLYLGNMDGNFHMDLTEFHSSAERGSEAVTPGGILSLNLRNAAGKYNKATFDLNLCVGNYNGSLIFRPVAPHQSLLTSSGILHLDGAVLVIYLAGRDGHFHMRRFNLDSYYGNNNGAFVPGTNFSSSARNISLLLSDKEFILQAELNRSGTYVAAQAKLSEHINNSYGNPFWIGFIPERPPTVWVILADFFAPLPFVGLVIGGIYALMGEGDKARRALALSANSTIVTIGIMIGTYFGGPLGGAIGAAFLTPIGIFAEQNIDETIQRATLERYIFETLRNGLAAGGAGYLTHWMEGLNKTVLPALFKAVNEAFGGKLNVSNLVIETTFYMMLKRIIDALKTGVMPPEWVVAEAVMAKYLSPTKLSIEEKCE